MTPSETLAALLDVGELSPTTNSPTPRSQPRSGLLGADLQQATNAAGVPGPRVTGGQHLLRRMDRGRLPVHQTESGSGAQAPAPIHGPEQPIDPQRTLPVERRRPRSAHCSTTATPWPRPREHLPTNSAALFGAKCVIRDATAYVGGSIPATSQQ